MLNYISVVKKIIVASVCIAMIGCATQPTEQLSDRERESTWNGHVAALADIDAWRLQGRVAVRNTEDSWSASLFWSESEHDQEVRVVAPLGQGTAVVTRHEGSMAQLKLSNGKVFFGENASDLLHAQLGWYLPVESLVYWVKGMPDPAYPSHWELNEQGQLASVTQAGWQVDYQKYRQSDVHQIALPIKLALTRDDWRIKLVVRNWQDYKR